MSAQNILARFLFIEGDGRHGHMGQVALQDTIASGVKLSSASLAFNLGNASCKSGPVYIGYADSAASGPTLSSLSAVCASFNAVAAMAVRAVKPFS